MSLPVQGDGVDNRDGDKILIQRVLMRTKLYSTRADAPTPAFYCMRMIVFQAMLPQALWDYTNDANWRALFEDQSSNQPTFDQIARGWPFNSERVRDRKFRILKDKKFCLTCISGTSYDMFAVSGSAPPIRTINLNIKPKHRKITWTNDGGDTTASGVIGVMIFTDANGSTGTNAVNIMAQYNKTCFRDC